MSLFFTKDSKVPAFKSGSSSHKSHIQKQVYVILSNQKSRIYVLKYFKEIVMYHWKNKNVRKIYLKKIKKLKRKRG